MKRKRKFQGGGYNEDGKISSGEISNMDKVGKFGSAVSPIVSTGTDFYTKYLEQAYDPTLAKTEASAVKMERKLQKRKNMAGSIGSATASGAGIGAAIGTVGGPGGNLAGAGIGALAGLFGGIGMGAWLNSAGGRRYERKLNRAKESMRRKSASQVMAGQNMLQSRMSSMADGGPVKDKYLQPVNLRGLYNYMNTDKLIPEEMKYEDFVNLEYEDIRSIIPDSLYGLGRKYNIDTDESSKLSYYVNPVYGIDRTVPVTKKGKKDKKNNSDWSYGTIEYIPPTTQQHTEDRPLGYKYGGVSTGMSTTSYRKFKFSKKNKKVNGGEVTSDKAKEILKDGTAHGKPLTDKQKKFFGYKAGEGKADGGVIEGEGGPKDDAIEAKLDTGDFIIPTDADVDVVNDLIEYLGIDKRADVSQGDSEANVSNGEVLIPYDMTDKANEYLVNNGFENGLDDLAPKAEDKINMAKGGPVKKKGEPVVEIIPGLNEKQKKEYEAFEEKYLSWHPDKTKEDAKNAYLKKTKVGADRVVKYPKLNESLKKIGSDPLTYAGIATGLQTVGGIAALNKLGDRPERKVDNDLHLLATQTASEAMYGLDPRIKSGIEEQRQRDFTNVTKGIMEYGGGSSGTSYNLLTNAMREKGLADLEITQLDIAEKERKKDIHRNIMMEIINQRNRIQEGNIERYDTKEQAYSDLFRSGLENTIGLGKYAAQREFYKDVDKNITNAPLIGGV